MIVGKLEKTGWIQGGQSKAVYYFGKTDISIFSWIELVKTSGGHPFTDNNILHCMMITHLNI